MSLGFFCIQFLLGLGLGWVSLYLLKQGIPESLGTRFRVLGVGGDVGARRVLQVGLKRLLLSGPFGVYCGMLGPHVYDL